MTTLEKTHFKAGPSTTYKGGLAIFYGKVYLISIRYEDANRVVNAGWNCRCDPIWEHVETAVRAAFRGPDGKRLKLSKGRAIEATINTIVAMSAAGEF